MLSQSELVVRLKSSHLSAEYAFESFNVLHNDDKLSAIEQKSQRYIQKRCIIQIAMA
jgi:hypothetical protein